MARLSKAERIASFLDPDEKAKWVVPAQTGMHPFTLVLVGLMAVLGLLAFINNPWLQVFLVSTVAFAFVALVSMARYRLLAITDADTVVLRTRGWRPGTPIGLEHRVPRTEPFDMRKATWGHMLLGGERVWVHRRHQHLLSEADQNFGVAPRSRGKASTSVDPRATAAYRAKRAKKKVRHGGRRR